MTPSIFTPTPRDWPEDATTDPDNGAYLCQCLSCDNTFIGYKRRMCCKVCATEMRKVSDERAALVLKAGLSPDDWVLMTQIEVTKMHGFYAGQVLKLGEEKETRKELVKQVSDLLFQMQCAHTMGAGFHANHPMLEDVRAALVKAEKLDEVKP